MTFQPIFKVCPKCKGTKYIKKLNCSKCNGLGKVKTKKSVYKEG